MSKRFTSTLKWADPWFRRLSANAKMLWLYAVDHCDLIGIVELDLELVSLDCGLKCNAKNVTELGDRIQHIGGDRYFLPKFISFQYGKLSAGCRPHEKIIDAINSHGLIPTSNGYRYPESEKIKGIHTLSDTLSEVDNKGIYTHQEQDRNKTSTRQDKTRATELELREFCRSNGLYPRDVDYLWNRWESNGWQNGSKPIKDWKRTILAWKAQGYLPSQKTPSDLDSWPLDRQNEADELPDLLAIFNANKAKREAEEATFCQEPEPAADSDDGGNF